ncbi:MAG: sensor histidine kinase [Lachnospiraceae bacterium]|nr:sensor histidine kinase [Lachnospiraceae bacterium]
MKKGIYIYPFIFGLLYLGLGFAYRFDKMAICYGLFLFVAVGVICGIVNAYRERENRNRLLALMNDPGNIALYPEPRDITEKMYTDALKTLARLNNDLTLKAGEFDREKLDYYTMWVHQIKTPIAAAKLIMENSEFEDKGKLKMELFEIEQYVEMVLTSVRLFNAENDYVFNNVNVVDVVKGAVRKYAYVFIVKKLKMDLKDFELTAVGDEKWLSFVIEQILSNALKYTKEGGVTIYKRGESTLVIEDTGIGIREEDIPRVTQKGFTGFNGRLDKKATGIGLYLCDTILKRMNHSLTIESTVGVGTRVCIDLGTEKPQKYMD